MLGTLEVFLHFLPTNSLPRNADATVPVYLQPKFVTFVSSIRNDDTRVKTVLELCRVLPAAHLGTLGYFMRQLKMVNSLHLFSARRPSDLVSYPYLRLRSPPTRPTTKWTCARWPRFWRRPSLETTIVRSTIDCYCWRQSLFFVLNVLLPLRDCCEESQGGRQL